MRIQSPVRSKPLWPLSVALACLLASGAAWAEKIYRCGNEYTNKPTEAQLKACKLIDSGYVTVVPATKVSSTSAKGTSTAAPPERSSEQKARDSDARAILESELKKSEQKLEELQKEYNKGEPDKIGIEHKNHQRYLDRVADLKSNIERTESDIAGIKRELTRLR
jgi:hypothetical protein